MRKNHLGEVVVQELADPVAEEAVGEHVRDLLQVLRLDGTHVANVFLLQNVQGCSKKGDILPSGLCLPSCCRLAGSQCGAC